MQVRFTFVLLESPGVSPTRRPAHLFMLRPRCLLASFTAVANRAAPATFRHAHIVHQCAKATAMFRATSTRQLEFNVLCFQRLQNANHVRCYNFIVLCRIKLSAQNRDTYDVRRLPSISEFHAIEIRSASSRTFDRNCAAHLEPNEQHITSVSVRSGRRPPLLRLRRPS